MNRLSRAKLEESKELRKYRRRQAGVSAEGLLVGEVTAKKEGADVSMWRFCVIKVILHQSSINCFASTDSFC